MDNYAVASIGHLLQILLNINGVLQHDYFNSSPNSNPGKKYKTYMLSYVLCLLFTIGYIGVVFPSFPHVSLHNPIPLRCLFPSHAVATCRSPVDFVERSKALKAETQVDGATSCITWWMPCKDPLGGSVRNIISRNSYVISTQVLKQQ